MTAMFGTQEMAVLANINNFEKKNQPRVSVVKQQKVDKFLEEQKKFEAKKN